MGVVSSLSFELSEEIDESGKTHPLGELSVTLDTTPVPDFPGTISFTRSVFSFEWCFTPALRSIPTFLAGQPVRIFTFEYDEWWALPRDEDTVYFVWKTGNGTPDERPPTPIKKSALAWALVTYCRKTTHFDAEGERERAALSIARKAIAIYESSSSVALDDYRELRAFEWLLCDWCLSKFPRSQPQLYDSDTLETVLSWVRESEDDELAVAAYETLFGETELREETLNRMIEKPDSRLLDTGITGWEFRDDLAAKWVTLLRNIVEEADELPVPEGEAVDSITVGLYAHNDRRVRRRAAELLGEIGGPRATEKLKKLATGDDETVSQTARGLLESECE
ncbi:HEAT repeat domain-containing protein [Halorussus lipolyticus]|uniref:HEAT repeat domain-containing protein n=1 Tax=Halorussus lipolyticus TaxID=3034024 RepID=UPI0023E80B3F|nr:HEAT repeat domain-containing protein [Halorussus sp. DT80]